MTVQIPEPVRPAGDGRVALRHDTSPLIATTAITLKLLVVLAMLNVAVDPEWAHLDGKAPLARAVLFPLAVLALPAFWTTTRRHAPYPWTSDLLITVTCFADVLGNRLDLYDAVAWFDDGMHLLNAALVSAAFVLGILRRPAPVLVIVNATLAAGLSASLGWELFEYTTFLTRSTEWTTAYSDTIGDLALGWLGSAAAAVVVILAWRRDGP